ncbi:MAG: hypothetical protein R3323_08435 [Wenzhouxiangellaceae bacterium]|nr:hypothetical protein [Wenzhouxiangellaceae bacterium]
MNGKTRFDRLPEGDMKVMGADRREYDLLVGNPSERQTRSAGNPPGNVDRLPSVKLRDGTEVDITELDDGYELRARTGSKEWPDGMPLYPV